MLERIRELLSARGTLPVPVSTLGDRDDLYEAGLTSFGSVQLMLAIEEAFDVEFPDQLLTRKTFSSLAALTDAVEDLVTERV